MRDGEQVNQELRGKTGKYQNPHQRIIGCEEKKNKQVQKVTKPPHCCFKMWSLVILMVSLQASTSLAEKCLGNVIGDLEDKNVHGVAGKVRVADSKTIVVENFMYDGTGPDAFFWIGDTARPDSLGTIIPVTTGPERKLDAYTGQTVVLHLPGTKTVQDYKWLSVWCRQFKANFGQIIFPSDLANPAPLNLGALPMFAHLVEADSVTIVDFETIRFVNLDYDGNGPDAYFYGGSHGSNGRLVSSGIKLIWRPGKTNAGTNQKLHRALTGETITVKTPPGSTVRNFTAIGLWCVNAAQDFGSLAYTPSTLNVPCVLEAPPVFPNCEVLVEDMFQASWGIDGDKINVQLAGRVAPGNYLAFGRSGSDTRTLMEGSDVVVAWMDETTMSPMVVDYNLKSKAQCSTNDGNGACPDMTVAVGGEDDVAFKELLFGNGITRISYQRDLDTSDPVDKVIPTDGPIFVSWAIGPINPDGRVAKHVDPPTGNLQINFGRASSTCTAFTEGNAGGPKLPPWPRTFIKDTTQFRVEIGQSGGDRGYTGITGKVGWGIAWYVNGILIPEITFTRGVTYTFEVYGGNDTENSAQYHPFYITDDEEGGYAQKTAEEKRRVKILAGPTEGPFCNWQQDGVGISAKDFNSFAEYKTKLKQVCVGGSTSGGGVLTWTPDANTPETVYYQCYTHRFLGWKLNVNAAAGTKISLLLLLVMLGLVSLI